MAKSNPNALTLKTFADTDSGKNVKKVNSVKEVFRMAKISEFQIQKDFFTQIILDPKLKKYRRLIFAVPNGGSRNIVEASRMKQAGVTAGVSDVLCLIPRSHYHGLCIEFKSGSNRISEHQKEFRNAVEEQGYRYEVCYSTEEALKILVAYLGL